MKRGGISHVPNDRSEFWAAMCRWVPEALDELRSCAAQPAGGEAAAVATWLARWHLNLDGLGWIAGDALSWIDSIRREPASVAPTTGGWTVLHTVPPIALEWQPGRAGESRSEFLARAHRALDAYADKVQAWSRKSGVRRGYERGRSLPAGAARWELLVRHLLLGWKIQRVADHFDVDREAARKAIRDLAERLGVSLPRRSDRN